jgi:hypothetical protein
VGLLRVLHHQANRSWTAPEAPRAALPHLAGDRARLDAWLDFQRATLLRKCAGLTGAQLARRLVASSH